jgi:hypothetical protein
MRAIRNVLSAVGGVLLVSAMVASASAGLITGTQYTYTPGGYAAGNNAAVENSFTNGVYTSTDLSSGTLKDGYITTQADVNANPAFTVPAYNIGNGPAGLPSLFGTYDGPPISFKLNGTYDLSSVLIGYTIKNMYGVYAPTSVDIAVNGGSVLQTYTDFDNSVEYYPNGDARTYSIDLSSLNLTGVTTVQLKFHQSTDAGKEWTSLNEIQFHGTLTPEPSIMTLLATGLVALLAYAWRRRR